MGRFLLAIDEGTTGVTALCVDLDQRVVGRAYQEIPLVAPRPGWVEQDAELVWERTLATAKAAIENAKGRPSDVAAIGITNQRETTVVWDRVTGKPIHNALVWQDRRTADRCAGLKKIEPKIRKATGLVVDPYFSASKLEWILQHVDGAEKAAYDGKLAFGTMDAWLTWKLTGRHATDPTNASRTLLWDIHKSSWDMNLLGLFGVPESVVPHVVPSSGVVGTTKVFGGDIPVAGLVGDQQAALLGQRCFKPGQAKNTYGTGCFLLQHTGGKAVASRNGLLTTRAASLDGSPQYALEGAVFTAGALFQWLRDQIGLVASAQELDTLAAQVSDTAGLAVVPAFTGLGAPHWDPKARAAILGATWAADKRHLARAALEAVAMQCVDLITAMEKDSGKRMPSLKVDGGATNSAPLMQFQADILERPVVRPANVESTAMGAAFLAGHAIGWWGASDLAREPEGATTFKPHKLKDRAERMATWKKAVASVRAFSS